MNIFWPTELKKVAVILKEQKVVWECDFGVLKPIR
jgi:hypothetical protein